MYRKMCECLAIVCLTWEDERENSGSVKGKERKTRKKVFSDWVLWSMVTDKPLKGFIRIYFVSGSGRWRER